MILLLQIVILIIRAGGTLVSASTLPDPWRLRFVIGFGALGIIGLVLTVITYEGTPGVPHLGDIWQRFSIQLFWTMGRIKELLHLPALWVVLAFGIGVAFKWIVSLLHTIVSRPQRKIVTEWLSPEQAINEFVDQALLKQRTRARAQLHQIDEKLNEILTRNVDSCAERLDINNKIASIISDRNDAEYSEQRRNNDVIECLFEHLRKGRLIAKGIKIKRGKVIGNVLYHQHFG